MEGLKTLSDFFTENNIRTRRNLKSDIEKRTVGIHEQFLKKYTEIILVSFDFLCFTPIKIIFYCATAQVNIEYVVSTITVAHVSYF